MTPEQKTTGDTMQASGLVFENAYFSTADVERAVFYGKERAVDSGSPVGRAATLIVVNGEFFELSEEAIPIPSSPLTEDSPLLDLAESLEP